MKLSLQSSLFILIVVLSACKSEKLLESSKQSRPNWVYGLENGYLIIEGVGSNHDDAKRKAYTALKEKIVESIAVNVSSNVKIDVNEQIVNDLSYYKENTTVSTNISSDFLMALKGVSLTKANDFYWEKIKDRKKKQNFIHYHVKYPFSSNDLNKLIGDWEQLDKQLTSDIQLIEQQSQKTKSAHELIMLQKQISQLEKVFNEPKKTQANLVKSRIDKMLAELKFEEKSHIPGQLIVKIVSGNRAFVAEKDLEFESTCAKLIGINYSEIDEHYIISYDPDFCSYSNNENIVISSEVNNEKISFKTSIIENKNLAKISLNGQIKLGNLKNETQKWLIPIRSLNNIGFKVEKVEITIERNSNKFLSELSKKGNVQSYIKTEINKTFNGKADFEIEFESLKQNTEFENFIGTILNSTVNYTASGKIYYKSDGLENETIYRFEKIPLYIY